MPPVTESAAVLFAAAVRVVDARLAFTNAVLHIHHVHMTDDGVVVGLSMAANAKGDGGGG
eukprot:CAMPEP_0115228914 /NCGR_PEP_ID=MMETSP0270-20121206/31919_1 /TAXON_ID=71861 /ORGANISM="Scrippsiella trochoidea, Strain CCMP3099" /LENGTH=59 /DNA_ID=CAMNT_0002643437 /DNA_START=709 /DNA_END=889 /DNA_ORIENTATION=+